MNNCTYLNLIKVTDIKYQCYCQAPKGQKMPYPMLMRQIKRRKEKEKEQRERVGHSAITEEL